MADDKKGVNPIAVGLAGAVVGAAAAAGAIILADEKNRQKLGKTVEELKKQGFKVMEVVQNEAAEMKKIATQGVKTTKSTKKSK
jgi:16S rRNA C967 or C1407 C5-methylase (RsmB/RsmF family)